MSGPFVWQSEYKGLTKLEAETVICFSKSGP